MRVIGRVKNGGERTDIIDACFMEGRLGSAREQKLKRENRETSLHREKSGACLLKLQLRILWEPDVREISPGALESTLE